MLYSDMWLLWFDSLLSTVWCHFVTSPPRWSWRSLWAFLTWCSILPLHTWNQWWNVKYIYSRTALMWNYEVCGGKYCALCSTTFIWALKLVWLTFTGTFINWSSYLGAPSHQCLPWSLCFQVGLGICLHPVNDNHRCIKHTHSVWIYLCLTSKHFILNFLLDTSNLPVKDYLILPV